MKTLSLAFPLKVRGIKGVMIAAKVFLHNSRVPSYFKRGNLGKRKGATSSRPLSGIQD
jgi:hypothetical protein